MNRAVETWWNARPTHPAVARALLFDADQPMSIYALAPFRYAKVDGRHLVLAAWPAPYMIDRVEGPDRIKHVIAWEPSTDTSWMLFQNYRREAGDSSKEAYWRPLALFQDWAEARLAFILTRKVEQVQRARRKTPEADLLPGYLVLDGPQREHLIRAASQHAPPPRQERLAA